ncbi:MAG TPA: N-acetylneuraminate synthase family protein [Elusimicrobiota bacterium]|nr:N-acetylneuraminate synthase family protein [Elusimicrobiota bacterium]
MRKNPKTLTIAEIGENHLGQMDIAEKMIEEAARAGADVVKFQSYRGRDVRPDDPERAWFDRVALSDEDHRRLMRCARKNRVEFLSAPFSMERARFLVEGLGLRKIKVASSEMTNAPLLAYLRARVSTVYLSTGLADLGEVRRAVARLKGGPSVCVMHCVTQYPTPDHRANLRAIPLLAKTFPACAIGYSDHTLGTTASLAAVALGARVIERHFTLSPALPGTDHVLSSTPAEWRTLVDGVRRVEAMLGVEKKTPSPEERQIRRFVRTRWAKG